MKGKLIIISVILAVLMTACSDVDTTKVRLHEPDYQPMKYNDSIRKLVEEFQKSIDLEKY